MVVVSGVVLAAGRGTRFGGEGSKVWAPLAGRPLLAYALGAFARADVVDEIVVVARPGDEARAAAVARGIPLPTRVVAGGERRVDSARAGVAAARGELVLVHDGARPLASPDLIRRVLAAAQRHRAAVPTIPVSDTVRYAREGFLVETLDRSGLVLIQAPQGFRRELLVAGYAEAERRGLDLTDDAGAVLLLGHPVAAVPGDPANLKVTWPEDLALAKRLVAAGE
ncbi:MAG TPA: 2-C-methyl-D-erythritol 4-phosphate cytidylyltransferase [Candidatus Acetothermia bacterium]|nr:2-C-methyl-D-erythritol 4-phosphate cytidylyltransferase [Candidatus Acetothermia bacterium]